EHRLGPLGAFGIERGKKCDLHGALTKDQAQGPTRKPRASLACARLLLELLDIDLDAPAAREAHAPSRFIRDAKLEHLRLAGLDHVHRLGDHLALDAAPGARAEEGPVLVDDEMAADRTRRRPPGLDHGR